MHEISSGVSLSTPSDNPLGAAQAVLLSSTATSLSQYTTNQGTALSSLQQEDSTLGSVNTVLQSIHTLVLRAGDGSLNNGDRGSIATQLQSLRSQLMTLANATDPQGNCLVRRLSKHRAAVHHQLGRRRDLFGRHRHAFHADHRLAHRSDGRQRPRDLRQRGGDRHQLGAGRDDRQHGHGRDQHREPDEPDQSGQCGYVHDQLLVGDHLHGEPDHRPTGRADHEPAATVHGRLGDHARRPDGEHHRRAERGRQLYGDAGHARQHGRVRQSEPVDHHVANAGVGRRLDGQLTRAR